jgi:hypothetical protein
VLDTAAPPNFAATPRFDQLPVDLLEGEDAPIARTRPFRRSPRHQPFPRHLLRPATRATRAS